MTDEELAAIEARAQKATPGPWVRWTGHASVSTGPAIENTARWLRTQKRLDGGPIADFEEDLRTKTEAIRNAEFCAHAREDVPALCAEVRRLRERVAELEDAAFFPYRVGGIDNDPGEDLVAVARTAILHLQRVAEGA